MYVSPNRRPREVLTAINRRRSHDAAAAKLAKGLRVFVRDDKPDAPDLVTCWAQKGAPRQLVKLKNIPVLVVMSQASYHASYDHCTVKYLRNAGVNVTYTRLAEAGIHGNGHMMMLEKNNEAIAAVMMSWLDESANDA